MSSNRLRHVYADPRWSPTRKAVIARARGQCEAVYTNFWGEQVRCPVVDRFYGGRQSLSADHIDPYPLDYFDMSNLRALCLKHHGQKDGGRARHRSTE